MVSSVLAVVAVTGLGVSLYLFQPWRLVTDREVRETLPTVAEPSPAPAGTTGSSPTGAAPADVVLAAGDFVTHEHDTSGRAQLVRLADGRRQLLLRGLNTSDGPDLRVWLTDRKVLPGRAGWQVFRRRPLGRAGPAQGQHRRPGVRHPGVGGPGRSAQRVDLVQAVRGVVRRGAACRCDGIGAGLTPVPPASDAGLRCGKRWFTRVGDGRVS